MIESASHLLAGAGGAGAGVTKTVTTPAGFNIDNILSGVAYSNHHHQHPGLFYPNHHLLAPPTTHHSAQFSLPAAFHHLAYPNSLFSSLISNSAASSLLAAQSANLSVKNSPSNASSRSNSPKSKERRTSNTSSVLSGSTGMNSNRSDSFSKPSEQNNRAYVNGHNSADESGLNDDEGNILLIEVFIIVFINEI